MVYVCFKKEVGMPPFTLKIIIGYTVGQTCFPRVSVLHLILFKSSFNLYEVNRQQERACHQHQVEPPLIAVVVFGG